MSRHVYFALDPVYGCSLVYTQIVLTLSCNGRSVKHLNVI